jgi:uncharacterized integral membrane protein
VFSLLVVLVLFTALTAFLVQNSVPVTVSFLFWNFEASLAIVVLVSAVAGVVMALAVFSSFYVRRKVKGRTRV